MHSRMLMNEQDKTYKKVGHIIRWFLELLVIWAFVLPETGGWTCFALMMITIGIEFDHFDVDVWRKP